MAIAATATASTLQGLRGWLILVGFWLCLAPLRILKTMVESASVFEANTWAALTTPGTAAYHPLWAPLILGETIANVALIALAVVAICLFFRRRRAFPAIAIGFLSAGVAVQVLDLASMLAIPAAAAQLSVAQFRDAMQAAVGAAIWIPYFLRSKRVEATFVQ
jgi:hypothetical protein